MSAQLLIVTLLLMSSVAYFVGRKRAFSVAQGKLRTLHSLPAYYGLYVAVWCGLPALLLLALWVSFEGTIITNLVVSDLPDEIRNLGSDHLTLVVNDIKNLVRGSIVSSKPDVTILAAAERYRNLQSISHVAMFVVAIALGLIAGTMRQIRRFRGHRPCRPHQKCIRSRPTPR